MVAILHKRDSNLNRKENRTFCLPCYWLLTFFLFFLFCRFGVDLKQTKATERKKQKKRNSHTLIGCRKFFLFSFLLRFESRYCHSALRHSLRSHDSPKRLQRQSALRHSIPTMSVGTWVYRQQLHLLYNWNGRFFPVYHFR